MTEIKIPEHMLSSNKQISLTLSSLLLSCRGQAVEEEGPGAWSATRHATYLGPGGYCEDAVCPGGSHCGGEGLQARVCYWRGRCNPGESF